MSAITKPCETCAGNGRPVTMWNGVVDCVDCDGTGRVPDVEAMLRAELDAARTDNARLRDVAEKQSRGRRAAMTGLLRMARRKVPPGPVAPPVPLDVQAAHEREVSELYATVASVTAERDAARAEAERLRDIIRHNAPVVERLTTDLATVRADHRTATGTLLAVAAAYNGWAIRGVGQHRAEYALEQIGKALGKPF